MDCLVLGIALKIGNGVCERQTSFLVGVPINQRALNKRRTVLPSAAGGGGVMAGRAPNISKGPVHRRAILNYLSRALNHFEILYGSKDARSGM